MVKGISTSTIISKLCRYCFVIVVMCGLLFVLIIPGQNINVSSAVPATSQIFNPDKEVKPELDLFSSPSLSPLLSSLLTDRDMNIIVLTMYMSILDWFEREAIRKDIVKDFDQMHKHIENQKMAMRTSATIHRVAYTLLEEGLVIFSSELVNNFPVFPGIQSLPDRDSKTDPAFM